MNWELLKSKVSIIVLFLFWGVTGFSQVAPEKYWIQFSDKNNSPYSISNPQAYLSPRAISRRTSHNIAITSQDFPCNPTYIAQVKQAATLQVLYSSKWLNGVVVQTTDTLGLQQIYALPFVDEANSMKVANPHAEAKHAKFTEKERAVALSPEGQTENQNRSANSVDYGFAEHQNKMIHIDYIHDLGFTGQNMLIAVMDAGFRGADTDFLLAPTFQNNKIVGTWDFVNNEPINFAQHSTHGTRVLTCMAANLPSVYIGSAPEAQYLLLRSEDAPTENIIEEYNWVAAAEYADSAGADVFNTSLGYTTFDDDSKSHTYADLDGNTTVITIGADIAASKGILVVNSAGNDGANTWKFIGAPADGDSVLTIGAVWPTEMVAGFSSQGPSADGRVKPEVLAQGGDVPIPVTMDSAIYINGTSFSGPILAGAAAVFWESQPNLSNMEVYHAIIESANNYLSPSDKRGYGIPNFQVAYNQITSVQNDAEFIQGGRVYPNPVHNLLHVQVQNASTTKVQVYDVSGRQVGVTVQKGALESEVILSFQNCESGVYFVKVFGNNKVEEIKVIKQ